MANLVSDPAVNSTIQTATTAKQSVLAIKTQIGHERAVADTLSSRAKDIGVLSILCPAPLRGYVLLEAMNTDRLDEVVRSIKRARGIVQGEMKIAEIEHYLTPKPLVSGIVEGDIVELIAGPFKGEKARVQNIDEPKEEITVELFEALVPIPVTVKGDSVRVLEKEK
ncbi:MAG: transcription elongation factor Spt5 [Thermoplasmata archaeon]|nr:transcription elongation factor Spt5 [Thermoplasmata archaeon]